ncbi:MAG: glycerol kinase GlpK [Deltaproteobacteria bacterium]|nr:glycerol kinase GlpK [Deltaproteobacteria bacterium]
MPVISLDQGTTGSTVLVLDEKLRILGKATQEFPQIYPQPGWVEHDPEAIWTSVLTALEHAMAEAKIGHRDISAIGVTNQRETAVVWDRKTGAPERTAIVWQDRRTAETCASLKSAGHEARVRELTGLVLDPYFSATKLRWMLDHDRALAARAESGALALGTVDSFLVARLTGGAAHVTDPSNASRTLLFGLKSLAWEDELLRLFGVPRACLPEVRASAEVYGTTKGVKGLPDGIPIAGIAGDQQAALFGQACFAPGDAKCTYGTGAFLLMNTGASPIPSRKGLLTTVGWKLGAGDEKGEIAYALEGSAFIAGAAVQWLRDGLGVIRSASEIEALASSVPDSGGVVLVPAFAGLGAPHWRPDARGLITGMTRGTTKAHLARAALEGIALQNHDILTAMQEDSGKPLASLKVDGGASANDLLMQFQADVLGVDIFRPAIIETTALGAAFLAGLGAGVWKSKAEIARAWREEKRFTPRAERSAIEKHLARWAQAVSRA